MVASYFTYAQNSIITGKVLSEKIIEEVSIEKIEDGVSSTISTYKLSLNSYFGFNIHDVKEGFYLINVKGIRHNIFPIYLKGGENLNISINQDKLEFNSGITPENALLKEWEDMSKEVRLKSHYWLGTISTFKDFFPDFEILIGQKDNMLKKINTKNNLFNTLMRDYILYSSDYYAINFVRTPRTEHPTEADMIPYYKTVVVDNKFSNDNILYLPFGMRILSTYINYAASNSRDTDSILKMLSTDRQKGEYLIANVLPRINTYDLYLEFLEKYGNLFVKKSHKKALEEASAKLYETRKGAMAANFSYPDVDGKMVSLSDFKGKVVLIDVWATWCGPCRAQIPFIKKLEEELHGMDVVFLSVSVDEEKDKQKWLNVIKQEQLGGVHIFASGWSKITKDYKITGIPRFMLVDKQGNIITDNAPRPSEPELKELILKNLK